MTVVSFQDYTPPARFDSVAWENAKIEEAATVDGTWSVIDTVTLGTPDVDPSMPAARSFTTADGTGPDLWYRISFLDGAAGVSEPTSPVQNSGVAQPYATVTELARILKIRAPSSEQEVAMERVLLTATGEINSEIDLGDDDALSGWQIALATEVNLERAVEHWRQEESPFGLIGLGSEFGSSYTSTNSWERHALKLAPLKAQWGLA